MSIKILCFLSTTLLCGEVYGRVVSVDIMANTKGLECRLDKFEGIFSSKNFECGRMLGTNFLSKLENNLENLCGIFEEI